MFHDVAAAMLVLLLAAAVPKGISRGGILAACCEGSRRCRSRTGSEPGETANRALRSDPVGTSVSGQAGWRRETDQTSQRNCQTSRDATRRRLCRYVDLNLTREGWIRSKRRWTFGATLEQVKDGPKLVSATEATT